MPSLIKRHGIVVLAQSSRSRGTEYTFYSIVLQRFSTIFELGYLFDCVICVAREVK